jgi:antirestriction protein ArdC
MADSKDVYSKVTDKIIADLERGNLTWLQPWQAGHAAGQISKPLRAIGKPYQG